MPRKLIGTFLKLLVTVGLFVLLFRPQTYGLRPDLFGGVTPRSLWREMRAAEPSHLALWLTFAALIKLSGMLAGVLRWRLLLGGQGLKMPFWYMVQSWFVGRMFGIFVPGTIGLDGYRFYDSARYTKEVIKSATVIAVEKLVGFISLTFLVFLTFPLGFRLLKINVPVLAGILFALGVFVAISFLLLLNPRVIQVLVAIAPTPAVIRNKVDKLGAAITAYSGKRLMLLTAVVCGLWVHGATCFMFFCTMMSLRASNTGLADILFASPIMIYGTVIGPSVGGEGIREIAFGVLLGGKSGVATAVLFGHLGWWIGDFVPFLIGVPIFWLRSRPRRKELQDQLAAARREAAQDAAMVHLDPRAVAEYRRKLVDCALAGAGAGLIAGALIGLAEALWLKTSLAGLTELSALWWGPLVYGLVFLVLGIGVSAALAFLYLLVDRFPRGPVTFGISLGCAMAAGGLIAIWRFTRDVLASHPPTSGQVLAFAAGALILGLASALFGIGIGFLFPRGRLKAASAVALCYLLVAAGGGAYGLLRPPAPVQAPSGPAAKATGPNLILIVADALRADYLKMYSRTAGADTPNLEALARDAVLFDHAFAQASWTKPSFATIFTGRYPGSHTATGKVSMLPDGIGTFPGILAQAGYFTKGFANNPHIMSTFHYNQGFSDYVDLKPRLYLGARYSASKLALYEVLRHARHVLISKVSKKIDVRDFYQPAETVTEEALKWLDGDQRPKDAPFFLFLHYMDPHDPFMDHHHPGVGYARVRMENPDPDKYLEPMRAAYLSEVEYMDQYIGVLIAGLRQRGLYDDAVIVFTADHGEEFYDHGGWWHGQTLFDELIRVPLLLKFPRPAKAGAVNTDFARHIDLGPTLLGFAGAKPDAAMPGKSLVAEGGAFTNKDIGFVYAENDFENNILQSARTRDAKVIHANPDNPRGRAPVEYYDLAKDPSERTNLAGTGIPRETALSKLIGDMLGFIQGHAAEPRNAAAISSEQRDQLQGLGYLGAE
jgi:arylsulfatase